MSEAKIMNGNLEDLPLTDILQVLATQKKTGTLILQGKSGEGMIVVRNGTIVYAISPSKRMNLTELLLSNSIITEQQLEQALATQRESEYEKRLSSIFVELGLVDEKTLNKYICWQIENAVYDLFKWDKGEFYFEIDSVLFDHHVAVDAENLSLEYGFSPQFLIWEASEALKSPEYTLRSEPPEGVHIPHTTQTESVAAESAAEQTTAGLVPQVEYADTGDVESLFDSITSKSHEAEGPLDHVDLDTVLVVDDEAYFRRLITDCLQNKGFTVIGCSEVNEALGELSTFEKTGGTTILAAIIDVIMPETDGDGILGGFELLNKLNLSYPNLQVLMTSASRDPELQFKAFELGARNYLDKPTAHFDSYKKSRTSLELFFDELAFCLQRIQHEHMAALQSKAHKEEALSEKSGQRTDRDLFVSMDDLIQLQNRMNEQKNVKDSLYFLLKVAYEHFDKGLLYLVRKNDIIGLTGFDQTNPEQDTARFYTKINFTRDQPIVYNQIIASHYPFIGRLTEQEGLALLEKELTGFFEGEHYIVPLVCEGEAYALLHLSNQSSARSITNIDKFEIILLHLNLSIQKSLLNLKIKKQRTS
ncbi:DUF4388 domain-containing protein [bacterium]|nr:DUF4388 domain-containing protein [bacterium]